MHSYQHRKSHCERNMVIRLFHFYNGESYTDNTICFFACERLRDPVALVHISHKVYIWSYCVLCCFILIISSVRFSNQGTVHAPGQWETTLHCNIVPHWLGAKAKWPLSNPYSSWLLFWHWDHSAITGTVTSMPVKWSSTILVKWTNTKTQHNKTKQIMCIINGMYGIQYCCLSLVNMMANLGFPGARRTILWTLV